MAKSGRKKEAHASNSPRGSGDYYGTGIRNPVGKMRSTYMVPQIKPKKAGKPPTSLA